MAGAGVLAELRLTAGVAGTKQDLPALTALAARIQSAYRDAGYGGVVAYLPAQESADGTVVVRVVEGKLARVRVNGNRYFTAANVRGASFDATGSSTSATPASGTVTTTSSISSGSTRLQSEEVAPSEPWMKWQAG